MQPHVGNAFAHASYIGMAMTSMNPTWAWLEHTPSFFLSIKGEILMPSFRSLSPCRKNSSWSLMTHCFVRSNGRVTWPRSATFIAI
eukprot:CAMPEP_0177593658 /NCGR_PEP_ID=MMETSP0419_2-20121207/9293_1 /TAXON_ID=582737 /ORGANISM="Tetraselmis sp., Strain GSL018" /LENGTH=85 /DNA_ID=CAMNT_0019084771 /DNA_START=237 /DNA_END=494 /DNA_ORIENTATION=-